MIKKLLARYEVKNRGNAWFVSLWEGEDEQAMRFVRNVAVYVGPNAQGRARRKARLRNEREQENRRG